MLQNKELKLSKRKNSEWYKLQEEIKDIFESLGLEAKTNVEVEGARANHDIDVLVKPKFLGREMTWVVEVKNWKNNVPKKEAGTLISIVQDVGADRGFGIAKKGFQSGAYDLVTKTNITLLGLQKFKESIRDYVDIEVIKHYEERVERLHSRYWSHPKEIRKDYQLRHDSFELSPFSGITLLGYIEKVITSIKERSYPIDTETGLEIHKGECTIENFQQACNWLNLNLNLLEHQLLKAEQAMLRNGDFKPQFERWKV